MESWNCTFSTWLLRRHILLCPAHCWLLPSLLCWFFLFSTTFKIGRVRSSLCQHSVLLLISAGPRALDAIDTLTVQLPLQTRPDLPNSRLTQPTAYSHLRLLNGHLELTIDYHAASSSPDLSLLHCSGQSSVPSRTPTWQPSLTLLFLSPPPPPPIFQ